MAIRSVLCAVLAGAAWGVHDRFPPASTALYMLAYVFGTLAWANCVSYIAQDNDRSARLAQRLGAIEDGIWTTPRGTQVRVFRHRGQA